MHRLTYHKNSPFWNNAFSFPAVIKPATHGSSIGLSIVDTKREFKKALDLAFTLDDDILIEEYLRGREITVGILKDVPLPVIEIRPGNRFFDYQAKYKVGMTRYVVPAKLKEEISCRVKQSALLAHKFLGCEGFSRVDLILKDNRPYILEVNTIPGLTQTSLLPKAAKVIGLTFNQLCLFLLKLAYEKKKIKNTF
jgi:D-alanine-D-alanine ligase